GGRGVGSSVVIPTHNDARHLPACLAALESQCRAAGAEVVVADDASTDPTADLVRARYPWVRYVRSSVNRGPGATRNLGWRAAAGEIVAFVDSDVTVAPGWLANGLRYFAGPEVGGVEGRVVVSGAERVTPFTHWTQNLERLGGFDERFYDPVGKVHFREDVELAFRVLDAGWRIPFAPDVLAYHPPLPGSARRPLRLAQRYYFDPLLQRLHPRRFAQSVERHELGPLVVRRPRHYLSFLNVASALAVGLSLAGGRHWLALAALPGYLASLGLLVYAPARRSSRLGLSPRRWLATVLVFAGVPWTYVLSYLRGAWPFRRWPWPRKSRKASRSGERSACSWRQATRLWSPLTLRRSRVPRAGASVSSTSPSRRSACSPWRRSSRSSPRP
ncbi:MAG: glycosyltransferase, partial [Chloroflexi bacterium]|nr:glycosyltransferase [Chloroflexota bacterium]